MQRPSGHLAQRRACRNDDGEGAAWRPKPALRPVRGYIQARSAWNALLSVHAHAGSHDTMYVLSAQGPSVWSRDRSSVCPPSVAGTAAGCGASLPQHSGFTRLPCRGNQIDSRSYGQRVPRLPSFHACTLSSSACAVTPCVCWHKVPHSDHRRYVISRKYDRTMPANILHVVPATVMGSGTISRCKRFDLFSYEKALGVDR